MVPEHQPYYRHTVEGPDDMPAHIKASMLDTSLSIPVQDGQLAFGTWQGIYLNEHRDNGGPVRSCSPSTGSGPRNEAIDDGSPRIHRPSVPSSGERGGRVYGLTLRPRSRRVLGRSFPVRIGRACSWQARQCLLAASGRRPSSPGTRE
jgi:hypothetical protein